MRRCGGQNARQNPFLVEGEKIHAILVEPRTRPHFSAGSFTPLLRWILASNSHHRFEKTDIERLDLSEDKVTTLNGALRNAPLQ